jgi:hypothetical protein
MGEESQVSLFRLNASIRVDGSHSRAIADTVEQEWRDGAERRRNGADLPDRRS